jgi:murein DD-endopeptidase MepM/ murein hydrolase activator NlpD
MNILLRRALTVSVAGVCLTALGTLTIPAAVAAIELAQVDASAQSFQLSTNWAKAAEVLEPERDEFDVTEFTLVQWPVGAGTSISSYFGYRSCEGCSSFHTGIDFTPGAGTPIEAVADGVVVSSPVADGSWGVHVTIEHDIDGSIYRTSYAHLQTGSMSLQMGDTVERGQVIGRVGSTGQSNGAHLHFTVQTADGAFINPLPWMTSHVNILD